MMTSKIPHSAVLIFSGGMDSTTLLYNLLDVGSIVHCLSFNYGQRHAKELDSAMEIITAAEKRFDRKIPHMGLPLTNLVSIFEGSNSSQVTNTEVPEGMYDEKSMRQTVVPNRNMIMISIATAYAISRKLSAVMFGAHRGDHAVYPDCRESFVKQLGEAITLCDWSPPKLLAPYVEYTKTDIARFGYKLKVPFEMTWSCYKGNTAHCGKCGTCVERKEAFRNAKVVDPTTYTDEAFKIPVYRGL